jgi:hypothetical protein
VEELNKGVIWNYSKSLQKFHDTIKHWDDFDRRYKILIKKATEEQKKYQYCTTESYYIYKMMAEKIKGKLLMLHANILNEISFLPEEIKFISEKPLTVKLPIYEPETSPKKISTALLPEENQYSMELFKLTQSVGESMTSLQDTVNEVKISVEKPDNEHDVRSHTNTAEIEPQESQPGGFDEFVTIESDECGESEKISHTDVPNSDTEFPIDYKANNFHIPTIPTSDFQMLEEKPEDERNQLKEIELNNAILHENLNENELREQQEKLIMQKEHSKPQKIYLKMPQSYQSEQENKTLTNLQRISVRQNSDNCEESRVNSLHLSESSSDPGENVDDSEIIQIKTEPNETFISMNKPFFDQNKKLLRIMVTQSKIQNDSILAQADLQQSTIDATTKLLKAMEKLMGSSHLCCHCDENAFHNTRFTTENKEMTNKAVSNYAIKTKTYRQSYVNLTDSSRRNEIQDEKISKCTINEKICEICEGEHTSRKCKILEESDNKFKTCKKYKLCIYCASHRHNHWKPCKKRNLLDCPICHKRHVLEMHQE